MAGMCVFLDLLHTEDPNPHSTSNLDRGTGPHFKGLRVSLVLGSGSGSRIWGKGLGQGSGWFWSSVLVEASVWWK